MVEDEEIVTDDIQAQITYEVDLWENVYKFSQRIITALIIFSCIVMGMELINPYTEFSWGIIFFSISVGLLAGCKFFTWKAIEFWSEHYITPKGRVFTKKGF